MKPPTKEMTDRLKRIIEEANRLELIYTQKATEALERFGKAIRPGASRRK